MTDYAKTILCLIAIAAILVGAMWSCTATYSDCDRDNGRVMKNVYGMYECVEKGEH